MTQEDKELRTSDKELLLKDLCARLPYKLVCEVKFKEYGEYKTSNMFLDGVFNDDAYFFTKKEGSVYSNDYKPYLFPLSSMTEEQKKEYEDALTYHDYVEGGWTIAKSFDNEYIIPYWFVDFCNKNHFDYRGLIPKGLAIDATGLNIY